MPCRRGEARPLPLVGKAPDRGHERRLRYPAGGIGIGRHHLLARHDLQKHALHRPRILAIGTEHAHRAPPAGRSEEHTSELQSLMRISYAVFCLKKKTTKTKTIEY